MLGNSLVQTIATGAYPNREYPIAVADTVRTFGGSAPAFGREYDLAGAVLGATTYTNDGTFGTVWDGATNGNDSNYSLTQSSHQVVRYDSDWANPTLLFNTVGLDNQWGGITYDSASSSIWVKARGFNAGLRNYALDGTLLGSFTVAGTTAWGLAYEEATDSFWSLGINSTNWSIVNFDKTGNIIEEVTIVGLTGNILGGEMRITATVAEPATLGLFGLGMLGLGLTARRRKTA